MNDGKIIWVNGDYPARIHDAKVFDLGGFASKLEDGVEIIADKGYVGSKKCVAPRKECGKDLSEPERFLNQVIHHNRAIVERVFGLLKRFHCLREWRDEIYLHSSVFRVLTQMFNWELTVFEDLD